MGRLRQIEKGRRKGDIVNVQINRQPDQIVGFVRQRLLNRLPLQWPDNSEAHGSGHE